MFDMKLYLKILNEKNCWIFELCYLSMKLLLAQIIYFPIWLDPISGELPTLSKLLKMKQDPAGAQNFNILNNDKRAFY